MNNKGCARYPLVFLCQLCAGDLKCISHGGHGLPRYICTVCRRVWKYIGGGWDLVADSTVAR